MDLAVKIIPHLAQGSRQAKEGNFSQAFGFRPPQEDLHQVRGQLFALISMASPDPSLDLKQLTKLTWDTLHQEYFRNTTGSPASVLRKSLQKTQEQVRQLLVSPQSGQSKILDLNLTALVIWGNTYHLLQQGENAFFILRHQILQALSEEKRESDVLQKSNVLQNGDLLLLITQPFLRQLGKETLSQILLENNHEGALACLKEELAQQANPASDAFIALLVEEDLVPSPDEVIEIADVDLVHPKNQPWQLLESLIAALKNALALTRPRLKLALQRQPFLTLANLSLPQFKLGQTELYIKKSSPAASPVRKKLLILGLLIFIFALSVLITYHYKKQQADLLRAQEQLALIDQRIDESKRLAQTDPERAKKTLKEAKSKLGEVLGARGKKADSKAKQLAEEIEKVFTDNYQLEKLSVATTENSWPQATYQITAQGVTDSQGKLLLPSSPDWSKVAAVRSYFNNLYLLDTGANQIHKYLLLPRGYSKRFNYFKNSADLSHALDFAIDGSIYILSAGGQVQKYLGGESQEFHLSGFYPPLEKITGIFTTLGNKNLYLFGQKQILIFDKEGVYQKGFELEGIEKIEKLFVNEAEKTIWLKNPSQTFIVSY